eukprot:2541952-Prymnesium_polylepis.1
MMFRRCAALRALDAHQLDRIADECSEISGDLEGLSHLTVELQVRPDRGRPAPSTTPINDHTDTPTQLTGRVPVAGALPSPSEATHTP